MWNFLGKQKDIVKEEIKPDKPEVRSISSDDDLLKRAENIVWCMGIRGAVENYVLAVFKALRQYETLDKSKSIERYMTDYEKHNHGNYDCRNSNIRVWYRASTI